MAGLRISGYQALYKNTASNSAPLTFGAQNSRVGQTTNINSNPVEGVKMTSNGYGINPSKTNLSAETRLLLRDLNNTQNKEKNNPYDVSSNDMVNSLMGDNDKDEDDKLKVKAKYNYKDVSSKIRAAKTSQSAGQAVISAKRKVVEIKRKIAANAGDSDELQAALSHAQRMEMAARKKKHNLELEELVENTGKVDKRLEKSEDLTNDLQRNTVMAGEEKIAEQEDKIFKEREDMLDEVHEEIAESKAQATDEMMAELNEMIAEFGEDELKELEEAMQSLEELEIINPHMSEEDLKELKTKHRNDENKAMMKADMDYLKAMIKYYMKESSVNGAATSSTSTSAASYVSPALMTPQLDVASQVALNTDTPAIAMPSIDISL